MMNIGFVGHPFFDVGVATLAAMASRAVPADLTNEDLEAQADWLARNYARNPLKSFLTVAFTSNAWFSQSSFNEDRRDDVGRKHLFAWQAPGDETQRCVFTGQPAVATALSDSLAAGRGARAQVPLTQGDEMMNFVANGEAGLPISGLALLCLQAFPLGCAKVSGRLLAVHSSDDAVTMAFAKQFWHANAAAIQLAQTAGDKKMAESRFTLGTTLIHALTEILTRQGRMTDAPVSVTAYYWTNAGQGADLEIFHLPLGVTTFLRHALGPSLRPQWDALVASAWQQPKPAKAKSQVATDDKPKKNFLYEDLLGLPDGAARFLRRYFVRGLKNLSPAASWALTELYLHEVMVMEQNRIENIKSVADRLADYIASENDRRLFNSVYAEMRYGNFRGRLVKADLDAARRGQQPVITFDQWIAIFEDAENYARVDWKLARDVMLIRVIEQLSANGWLAQNGADLPDRPDEEDNSKGE